MTDPKPGRELGMTEDEIRWRIKIAERRLHTITPPRSRSEVYESDMLKADVAKLKAALAAVGGG